MSFEQKVTIKQIIEAVESSETIVEAAEKLGVATSTIHMRLREQGLVIDRKTIIKVIEA